MTAGTFNPALPPALQLYTLLVEPAGKQLDQLTPFCHSTIFADDFWMTDFILLTQRNGVLSEGEWGPWPDEFKTAQRAEGTLDERQSSLQTSM